MTTDVENSPNKARGSCMNVSIAYIPIPSLFCIVVSLLPISCVVLKDCLQLSHVTYPTLVLRILTPLLNSPCATALLRSPHIVSSIQPSRRWSSSPDSLLRRSISSHAASKHAAQHIKHGVALSWYLDPKVHLSNLIQRLIPIHLLEIARIMALQLAP